MRLDVLIRSKVSKSTGPKVLKSRGPEVLARVPEVGESPRDLEVLGGPKVLKRECPARPWVS